MFHKNKLLIIVFAISLLAHVIVIYVMARSTKLPAMTELAQTEQPVIQARLIFELPPIVEPAKEKKPAPETPNKTKVEPQPEPKETQLVEPITDQASQVDEPPTQPPIEASKAIEKEQPLDQEADQQPFFQQNTDLPKNPTQNPLTNMARRHLRSFQQQQRNKVAEQAARAYQQRKNSPIIDEEVKDEFLSEDEKFRNTRVIKADCSSASKKTTAVLLSFLGGQVDCSKPPPISSFIQNRINKDAQLPSLNHEQKKRPKSVVIENQP